MSFSIAVVLACFLNLLVCFTAYPNSVVVWGFTNEIGNVPNNLSDVTKVACGNSFMAALKANGQIVLWGGEGPYQATNYPIEFTNTNVVKITADFNRLAVLKSDGWVFEWNPMNQNVRFNVNEYYKFVKTNVNAVYDMRMHAGTILFLNFNGTVTDNNGGVYGESVVKFLNSRSSEVLLCLRSDGKIYNGLGGGPWDFRNQQGFTNSIENIQDLFLEPFTFVAYKNGQVAYRLPENPPQEYTPPTNLNNIAELIVSPHSGPTFIALKKDGTLQSWGWTNSSPDLTPPVNLQNVIDLQASPNCNYVAAISSGDNLSTPFINEQNAFALAPYLLTNPEFISSLATNQTFLNLLTAKITNTSGNYGLATKADLETAAAQGVQTVLNDPNVFSLYTQSQHDRQRQEGQNDVLTSPNNYSLYSTNQIYDMNIGKIILARSNNEFHLRYEIEQSSDLVNWSPYQSFELEITNSPAQKQFLRFKAKQ